MPEFEENKPNLDLHKESHHYQPSKGRASQENSETSGQEKASTTASSNMRGRWKRPSRMQAPKSAEQKDAQVGNRGSVEESVRPAREERTFSPNEDYEIEDYENEEKNDDEESVQEIKHISRNTREERSSRPHASRKPIEQKPFKPTSKKDVFIPKTKQDSERFRRDPSIAKRKPSLWRKILAFLGLAAPIKKRSSESKAHAKSSDASRGPRHSSHNRRPYQQKRHTGHQRHRAGSHKQDHKSKD